jgi:anti-anti-sigma factor
MTHPDETMTITTRRTGDTTAVVLSGELDMHSCEQLATALAAALDDSPKEIGVDARELSFTDSAGLRALLVARDAAAADGVVLRLTHVSDHLDRLLDMTGLREVLGVTVS